MSLTFCGIGCFVIMLSAHHLEVMPVGVFSVQIGISSAFTFLYIAVVGFFEPKYRGFAIGFCNIFGRVVTLGAPIVSEAKGIVPMMVCICFCAMGVLAALFLRKDKETDRI